MSMVIVHCREVEKSEFLYYITYAAQVKIEKIPTLAKVRQDIKLELGFHPMREKPKIEPEKGYRKKLQAGRSFGVKVMFNEKQTKVK